VFREDGNKTREPAAPSKGEAARPCLALRARGTADFRPGLHPLNSSDAEEVKAALNDSRR